MLRPISPLPRRPPTPWVVAALVLLLLITAAFPVLAGVGCPVHDLRLRNGLRVLICPVSISTDVAVQVRYDVGSRDEPGGLEGIAHLAEHLMFAGSRHVGANAHLRLLDEAGGSNLNGRTLLDSTVYHETVPPESLPLALWLESDRMGYLLERVDTVALERERAAVINEYREKVLDRGRGSVPYLILAELFPTWHPYHHPPAGTPTSLRQIQLADVRAFLGTWYGPENAALTIAGPVDPARVAALAQGYFASLPPRAPPVRPALPPLPRPDATILRVGAGVTRASVHMAWITPALHAPGDAELDVAALILAERGSSGWLQRRLGAMAVSVYAGQDSKALASIFRIEVTLAPGYDGADGLRAVDDALARFDAEAPAEELRRSQVGWFATQLYRLESPAYWAGQLAGLARDKPSVGFFDGDLAKYSAVTPDQVRAAMRTYLGRAHRVVALVEPSARAPLRGVLLDRRTVSP